MCAIYVLQQAEISPTASNRGHAPGSPNRISGQAISLAVVSVSGTLCGDRDSITASDTMLHNRTALSIISPERGLTIQRVDRTTQWRMAACSDA